MSLTSTTTAQDVYNALFAKLTSDTLELGKAVSAGGALEAMQSVLKLFNMPDAYEVKSAELYLNPGKTVTTLNGTADFTNWGPQGTGSSKNYTTSLNMVYTQNDGLFKLSLTISGDWTFSDFFGDLPPTLMQDLDQVEQGITWRTSVLTYLTIRGAIFSAQSGENQSLHLNGSLLEPSKTFIMDKMPMVSPWPLRVSGTVGLATDERSYPLLELYAQGSPATITGNQDSGVDGPSTITLNDPGIIIISAKLDPPQPSRDAFSTLELYGDFALGDIKGQISTLILSTGAVWNFVVRFDKDTSSFVQGLAQLAAIFGVDLPIPMNFPILSDFYIAEIDIDLQNKTPESTNPTFSFLNLAITIRSDKTWVPPIPFVTLSNVGTRWVWGWTSVMDQQTKEYKNIYTLNGSVFGTFNFGGGTSGALELPSGDDEPDGGGSGSETSDVEGKGVSIYTQMSIPNFFINGFMLPGDYIPLGQALNYFFGNTGPDTGAQMNVTQFQFSADPIGQYYYANATILFGDPANPDPTQGWTIDLVVLEVTLHDVEFYIQLNSGNVSGGLQATLYLDQGGTGPDYAKPRINVGAEYPRQTPNDPQGWIISGSLYPGTSISLTKLVTQFIYGNGEAPNWIPQVTVDRLYAMITTGSSTRTASYQFGGTVSARWTPDIFGETLKINASASVDIQKQSGAKTGDVADDPKVTGSISGAFSVNKLLLEAAMTFGVPEKTYQFKIQFDELWVMATTSWRTGLKNDRHQVLSIQLGGTTLGDILEYLVNLAAPTLGFKLDSPWDVLKRVDLSRFVLTIDPTDNIVEFVFKTDVNLVVAKLDSIGVRYTRAGNEGKVDMILTGNFLGQAYTEDKPLSWDVINDPPPEVPGKGKSMLDLRYLGFGQRVALSNPPDTVAESIAMLRKDMQPPDPDTKDPLSGQSVVYSADSQWLIGIDLTLMDAIDFGFIFNDPILYGLSIGLNGEKVGSLAGLRFEILYKKITNDIGMFRVEFQVPIAFRTIQLGAVSITLGIIVVEIYTNGNFKVDLGFPYNRNFERSFTIQASIFIGRGGFYLGVLNGDTSTQVPKITNGDFSPVIELGIGIAAGVGREVREGVLSGGAYVELEVIFQGVLAWFNPSSKGVAPAKFFKCHGVVALHGKVYGAVDFAVIKVSVTLEAYAQVSITYEVYQPMLIEMEVDVKAEASVKVLFIKIHFSFHVNLELDFTIGSAEKTPWIIDGNGSGNTLESPKTMVFNAHQPAHMIKRNAHRREKALRNTHLSNLKSMMFRSMAVEDASTLDDDTYGLHWNPSKNFFGGSAKTAHMTLLPMFTAGDIGVSWTSTPPVGTGANYRTAFVLFADTGMDPSSTALKDLHKRSAAHSTITAEMEDTSDLAADILVEGLVKYAIDAVSSTALQDDMVTAGQISLLIEQLDLPETSSEGFAIDKLYTFFGTNIHLSVTGDPGTEPSEKGAMVIPMPPLMSWTSAQVGDVNFDDKNRIGPWYEWGIAQILNQFFPIGAEDSSRPADDNPDLGTGNYESFASFVFRDFCLMMVKSAIKEVQNHLNETTVTVAESGTQAGKAQSLDEVAKALPQTTVKYTLHAGDTLSSVAASLGATPEELEFLNDNLVNEIETKPAGTSLDVVLGIAPEVLALDNAGVAFKETKYPLGYVLYQTRANDTFETIAKLFYPDDAGSDTKIEADVTTMLGAYKEGFPKLSSDTQVLLPGSMFTQPAVQWSKAPSNANQLRVAGTFFVRYCDPKIFAQSTVPEYANWYAQVIADLNEDTLKTLFPDQHIQSDIELPPGHDLTVPDFFQSRYKTTSGEGDAPETNTYTTVNGDTLNRIGYALALSQDFRTTSPQDVPQWQTFQAAVSQNSGKWSIPEQTNVPVEVGESIEKLVRRLIVDAEWTQNGAEPTDGSWAYTWSNVAKWITKASVLQELASITVPDAVIENTPLSFEVITQKYGLAVLDSVSLLKSTYDLYSQGQVLTVKVLPAQKVSVLISAIQQGSSFSSIVNQSSRMMMSGLQLPNLKEDEINDVKHIIPDPDASSPLYDLTGQQFTVDLSGLQSGDTAFALTVETTASWITLVDSTTISEDHTLENLRAAHADLDRLNPGLRQKFVPGNILLTGDAETGLGFSYTKQQVLDNSPATTMSVQPVTNVPPYPMPIPLSGTVPVTYGLDHRIELQSPVDLPIPAGSVTSTSDQPSLWMFPSELIHKAKTGSTVSYETLYTELGSNTGNSSKELTYTTFGMVVPFKVKQLESGSEGFELIGVDTNQRYLLLALRTWLSQGTNAQDTKAYLLLSPAPNASNTSGLTVLNGDDANTFLIKSNLSEESVPPASLNKAMFFAREEEPQPLYSADITSLKDFVTLLWEGSVVGGFGYYFGAGQEIPGSAIDQQGNITLQLLVIAGTQQGAPTGGRTLLPFNNCSLVGPGLDPSYQALFIQSAGNTSTSETIQKALVPPGNVGFELVIDNPDYVSGLGDQDKLVKDLYSLLAFSVGGLTGSPFATTGSGMPVLPYPSDSEKPSAEQPWQKQRNKRLVRQTGMAEEPAEQPYWHYSQVLPAYRFVISSVVHVSPEVTGLPSPDNDPYHGFGAESSQPTALFHLDFGDVLGNRSQTPPDTQGQVSAKVGYTDNLIGLAEWPSIARNFEVSGAAGSAEITSTIALKPSELLPSPSQPGDVHTDVIDKHIQQYGNIYYQLIQPNITGWIVSSLKLVADANYGNKGVEIGDISPLWKFAAGSYVNANSLKLMPDAHPDKNAVTAWIREQQGVSEDAAVDVTLDAVVSTYNIRFAELAEANSDVLIATLFDGTLPKVPAYYPFVEHQTGNDVFNAVPSWWPKPVDTTALLELEHNEDLPLKVGTIMTIPVKSISTGTDNNTPTLEKLAENNHADPILLAVLNKDEEVLKSGFAFKADVDPDTQRVVTTSDTLDSFSKVLTEFLSEGVQLQVEDLAHIALEEEGLFQKEKPLNLDHYVVQDNDSIKTNKSGTSISDLVTNNLDTPDLFDPGALVFFGEFSGVTAGTTPPTLTQLSDRYACPSEQLLTYNGSFVFTKTEIGFVLPGTLDWPADKNTLHTPYTIRSADTLTSIGGSFFYNGTDSIEDELATINQNMPGTVQKDQPIHVNVDGHAITVTMDAVSSFTQVLDEIKKQPNGASATLKDLVTGIKGTANILQSGALFICPVAKLASAMNPSQIETQFGVSAASFGLSNAAMQGLVIGNQTLYSPDGEVSIKTEEYDTFNTLVVSFAKVGVTLGVDDIFNATKNQTVNFLKSGGNVLLPPKEVSFTTPIGSGGPYSGPISPLSVSLRLIRPHDLIYEDFTTPKNNGPVEMVESSISAPAKDSSTSSGLNFNAFVTSLESALPNVRLGTGKVSDTPEDLWIISFDADEIKKVSLEGATTINSVAQPRFFAITPPYDHLVTRSGISIKPLKSDGTLGDAQTVTFQGVDVEVWTLQFVQEMDRFLTGPYALAMYQKSTTTQKKLLECIQIKDDLISKIAQDLDYVLTVQGDSPTTALTAARKALEDQLGVSLSRTYETSVLVQYNSMVESKWQSDDSLKPANLYGDGNITFSDKTKAPGLNMVSSKTKLSEASDFVNFLITVDNPEFHHDIQGKFGYNLSHVEFNISTDNVPDQYTSSDWLSFLPLLTESNKPTALKDTDPAKDVDVPIPLRTFPALPIISGQSADQMVTSAPAALDDLSKWNYGLVYSHQHADQDYVVIKAEFNLVAPMLKAMIDVESTDLFTELAQYQAVSKALWADLSGLTNSDLGIPDATIENAVSTFVKLAGNVRDNWSTRLSQEDADTSEQSNLVAGSTYEFNARVSHDSDGNIITYELSLLEGTTQPGPNNMWPEVYAKDSQGNYIQLTAGTPTSTSLTYTVPDGHTIVGTTWPEFKLLWTGLNIGSIQNARGQMHVQRNQDLLDHAKTNPSFLFSTNQVVAPSVVTPLNAWPARIDITAEGADLPTALTNTFKKLFGDTGYIGQPVTMELSYGYELVTPSAEGEGLVTYLPIGLYPNQLLSATTGTTLQGVVTTWKTQNKPTEVGGEWTFSLKLYSSLVSTPKTMMTLDHLVFRITE